MSRDFPVLFFNFYFSHSSQTTYKLGSCQEIISIFPPLIVNIPMEDQPQIDWKAMTPEQRSKSQAGLVKVNGFKALLFAIALVAQPIWQAYFKDQDLARASEIIKNEKQAEAALSLSKAAISQVTILSSQLGELKSENQNLRQELASLTDKYTDLTQKYRAMETSYVETLEEKKKLEARIDELFKKHNAPNEN